MTLKYALAQNRGFWKFYKILRVLLKENFIREISHSESPVTFWTLTKKGFNYLNDGSMALSQDRFKPQAVLHDYWAMAFQLGEFVFKVPSSVEIISEQELNACSPTELPSWVPRSRDHIPDGMTRIEGLQKNSILAFEVELSTKEDSRYEEMIRYLDQNEKISNVLWLCANGRIVQKITEQILKNRRRMPMLHNFLLLEDFQKRGWSAPFVWGQLATHSLFDLWQLHGLHGINMASTDGQSSAMKIYFEIAKSPRAFKSLEPSVDPLGVLTP